MNGKWKRWEVTRSKGRDRFVWINGVVGFGLSAGLIWPFFMAALQGWDRLWVYLPLGLIGFPIGGYFWGRQMWTTMERKYHDDLHGNSSSPS